MLTNYRLYVYKLALIHINNDLVKI